MKLAKTKGRNEIFLKENKSEAFFNCRESTDFRFILGIEREREREFELNFY